MTPQNQLTKRGCIAACIATMLELPVEHIPDFTADDFENLEVVNGVEYPKWWLRLQGWLSERNLCFIEIVSTLSTITMKILFFWELIPRRERRFCELLAMKKVTGPRPMSGFIAIVPKS